MGVWMNGAIFRFVVEGFEVCVFGIRVFFIILMCYDSINSWDYAQASMIKLHFTYYFALVEEFVI
jgi:hypothetical protein